LSAGLKNEAANNRAEVGDLAPFQGDDARGISNNVRCTPIQTFDLDQASGLLAVRQGVFVLSD
jgi:hypothetical protein